MRYQPSATWFVSVALLTFQFASLGRAASLDALTPREIKIRSRVMERLDGRESGPELLSRAQDIADQEIPYSVEGSSCPFDSRTMEIHKRALYACDAVYDVSQDGKPGRIAPLGYESGRVFLDDMGFKAITFAPKDASLPRIYAIAGAEVTGPTDWRDVMTDLGMGLRQGAGPGAEELAKELALYAFSTGDAVITGQSLGGLLSQIVGYFAELSLKNLEARTGQKAKGRILLVTWSVIGGQEAIARISKQFGNGSDFPREYRPEIAAGLEGVGYFYRSDLFDRGGTFIGTSLAIPEGYLHHEGKLYIPAPVIGPKLEGHFLPAFKLASRRGGVCYATPALPPSHWKKATDATEFLGKVADLYWLKQVSLPPEARKKARNDLMALSCEGSCQKKLFQWITGTELKLRFHEFNPLFGELPKDPQ